MTLVLEGREVLLDLRWSQREESWYLDLRSADGVLLAGAIKVVVNYPLLVPYHRIAGVPGGELFAQDLRTAPADPELDELGDVVALIYVPAADVAEVAAEAA